MIAWRRSAAAALVAAGLTMAAPSASAQSAGVSYSYDALGRVVSVTYSNGANVTYTYDAAGNRTAVTAVAACGVWGSFLWGAGNWCSSGGQGANAITGAKTSVSMNRAARPQAPTHK